MRWLTVWIDTTHDGILPVSDMLSALGIDNIVTEDESEFLDFLESNRQAWDYVDQTLSDSMRGRSRVTFYVPEDESGFATVAQARMALENLRGERPELRPLRMGLDSTEDSDWEDNWKQYYQPVKTGERLLIIPQWMNVDPEGRIPVILDPGLTFGSGAHETTRLCLTMLEKQIHGGERILDIGCGSGILSIAALRLGAASAVATDIDELCVKVAAENAAFNDIAPERLKILSGNILTDAAFRDTIGKSYDMILSNIVADVITGLASIVPGLLAPDGQWICSGVIENRTEDVTDALCRNGFDILETASDRDWYAYRCVHTARNISGSSPVPENQENAHGM